MGRLGLGFTNAIHPEHLSSICNVKAHLNWKTGDVAVYAHVVLD
jgi:hypothetical protein